MTPHGVRIAFAESGSSEGPVMVMLHALGERGSDWDDIAERLGRGYRVFQFDLRGHGDSDWPGTYSIQEMVGDVEAVLDGRGLTAVTLLGHSLGGNMAYALTARRPDLVRRLVIEDVAPPVQRLRRPLPERPGIALPFDWEAVVALRDAVDDGDPDLWHALSSITVPTLIVAGGPGSHIDQEQLAAAADRLPNATLVTVPSSHNVHRDSPDDFSRAVLTWFTDLDEASL